MRFLHQPVFSRDDSAKIHNFGLCKVKRKKILLKRCLKSTFMFIFATDYARDENEPNNGRNPRNDFT